MSLNKVMLIGKLGKDPETRFLPDGGAVTTLSLATTNQWKGKDGNKQESTEWHRVVMFGKLAEIASEHLSKGSTIYVEGRIETKKWKDKDGNDKYSTQIVCDSMKMLGSKGEKKEEKKPSPKGSFDDMESDIPF